MKFAKHLNYHHASPVKQMCRVPLQPHLMSVCLPGAPGSAHLTRRQRQMWQEMFRVGSRERMFPWLWRWFLTSPWWSANSSLRLQFYGISPVTSVLFSTVSPMPVLVSNIVHVLTKQWWKGRINNKPAEVLLPDHWDPLTSSVHPSGCSQISGPTLGNLLENCTRQ